MVLSAFSRFAGVGIILSASCGFERVLMRVCAG